MIQPVRFTLDLGEYAAEYEPDWQPYRYVVVARHRTELTADGHHVTRRVLEGLDLVLEGDADAAGDDGTSLGTITLPGTLAGITALEGMLENARQYLERELEDAEEDAEPYDAEEDAEPYDEHRLAAHDGSAVAYFAAAGLEGR